MTFCLLVVLVLADRANAAAPAPSPSPIVAVAASSEYDSRFADIVNNVEVRRELGGGELAPYAAIDLEYDTRSGVPGIADVYNDNAAVARLGYRFALDPGGFSSAFATGGYSFGLRGQSSFPETRYGIEYARSFGSESVDRPNANVAASVTAYSRYQGNVIAEGSLEYETPLTTRLRTSTGTDLSLDDRREYENNYAEAFGGIRWSFAPALSLRVVGVAGTYLPRGVDPPSTRSYAGIRARLDFAIAP
ncbi:MAG TPA: hypothetical protein VNG31_01700 [Candidatus Baltobacteraceae bacterium]|nr:hypothetical protein [Candidatus Baltobacteraceae bacterium]